MRKEATRRSCRVHGGRLGLMTMLLLTGLTGAAQVSIDWVKGTAASDAWRCKVDRQGNLYTIGEYNSNTLDFDPGPGVFQSPSGGRPACFLEKLDSAGNFVWERSFLYLTGGASIFRESLLELDSAGNIYVAMPAEVNLDADPGPAVHQLTVNGSDDIALVKLDPAGNFQWGFRMGGTGIDNPYDIDVLPNGDFMVTGEFQNTIDFDPGPGTATFTSSSSIGDIFFAKYSSVGALIWVKTFTSSGLHFPGNVVVDAQGYSYWSGIFAGTGDLDPGPGLDTVTATFLNDVFLIRLDPNGNYLGGIAWAATNSSQVVCDLKLGLGGTIFIYFEIYGVQDLDPGPGTVMSPSQVGGTNTAMICLDTTLNYQWSWAMATGGYNFLHEFEVGPGGCVYFSGAFKGTIDFDPGPAVHSLTALSNLGTGFICQLDASGNYVNAWLIDSPSSSWVMAVEIGPDGKGYAVGQCGATCDFDPGPGVLPNPYGTGLFPFYWKWHACCPETTHIAATGCESYTYEGQTYTSSGTYSQTFTSIHGCDSVRILDLIIGQPTTGSLTLTGCDSVQANGQSYAQSGNYSQTLTNVSGCDSTLLLTVTILAVDTAVTVSGDSLVAVSGQSGYQWVDCDQQMAPIIGATQPIYLPPGTGNYAVIVTNGACSDTSGCHAWSPEGMAAGIGEGIQVFPSPTAGALTIRMSAVVGNCTYRIHDGCGRVVLQGECTGQETQLQLSVPAGMYGVTVQSESGETWHRRVFKL